MIWWARFFTLLCMGMTLAFYGVTLGRVVFMAILFGIAEVEVRRIRKKYYDLHS